MNLENCKTNSLDTAGQRGLSGCVLKMIAVITMLVDHTAATIVERLIVQMPSWGPVTMQNQEAWTQFYMLLRGIGRMAFPIYCFLLAEGFYHTKNKAKYALRLFVFALISEVPFDMAFQMNFFDISYNNVFFTLLMGLLTIWAYDELRKRAELRRASAMPMVGEASGKASTVSMPGDAAGKKGFSYGSWVFSGVLWSLVLAAVPLLGCGLAYLLRTDYDAAGVLAIFIMYLFYERRQLGFGLMVLSLGILAGELEFLAFFMLIPMKFYNGTRGRQMKYFFYWFYPVHLLILSLICMALGLG